MAQEQKIESGFAKAAKSGINYWREVRYLDDGVCEFQCLLCKHMWASPCSPGYVIDGEYKPSWKFCPFCATQWISGQEPSQRKAKLRALIDAYEMSLWNKPRTKERGWAIEYSSERSNEWRFSQKIRGNYLDAYRILRNIREEEDGDYLNFPNNYKQLYRARIVDL